MNKKDEEKLSKFMSLLLRHKPKKFGLNLDEKGGCTINELVTVINSQDNWDGVTVENIKQVVVNCPKQRYKIEGVKIKANYGHSSVKIPRVASVPPKVLYHGTNTKVVSKILVEGIKSMERDVHMSEGKEFATLAGKRRGELVILKVDSETAHKDGIKFFFAENEVWLSEYIPPKYLTICEKEESGE
ncbi:RNA 2'-phosphotransferase [Bacillus phage G]|uniref:Gp280 n=1 Tax=Bacillus phage G TaxID=2884420 RepID=G3MA21_9CAUD|nr:RNA 2'-phosphotransferase [Bacillus phage G]AEO93539.1 gp280 [Bacillus phage G]